jgi:peptidoglycan/xylan/chitin deacetylase (PgdA/CDA1 family)
MSTNNAGYQWHPTHDLPRDLLGYGPNPPKHSIFPNNARLALSFVINYEEGAESSVLLGDAAAENTLWENSASYTPKVGERAVNVESEYEYGSRVGVWRIMRLFEKFGMKFTLYAVGKAVEENPEVALRTIKGGSEVASHAYRWINYHSLSAEDEKEMIKKGVTSLQKITGEYPVGWYYGRLSPRSRSLVWEAFHELGLPLEWESDTYADDIPYWLDVPLEQQLHKEGKLKDEPKGMLMLPYSYDCNDFKFHVPTGFKGPGQFFDHLKNAFDTLYEEGGAEGEGLGTGTPKMMTVGLHCRIIGKPGRFAELKRFVEYVSGKEGVWVATRGEIASAWKKERPYKIGRL